MSREYLGFSNGKYQYSEDFEDDGHWPPLGTPEDWTPEAPAPMEVDLDCQCVLPLDGGIDRSRCSKHSEGRI